MEVREKNVTAYRCLNSKFDKDEKTRCTIILHLVLITLVGKNDEKCRNFSYHTF